jgi:hypothetical protein
MLKYLITDHATKYNIKPAFNVTEYPREGIKLANLLKMQKKKYLKMIT